MSIYLLVLSFILGAAAGAIALLASIRAAAVNSSTRPGAATLTQQAATLPPVGGSDDFVTNNRKKILEERRFAGEDLCGADLRKIELQGAYFHGADLTHANFAEADLTEATFDEPTLKADVYPYFSCIEEEPGFRATVNFQRAKLVLSRFLNADLGGADFSEADLSRAQLPSANLEGAKLDRANIFMVDLSNANLQGASLRGAYIHGSSLENADLRDADLSYVSFADSSLVGAKLTGCQVYGISAWNVNLRDAEESGLRLNDPWMMGPALTVDSLALAQFVYLLLKNKSVRHVIDTLATKAVLILGRFTPERKAVLNAIKDRLRQRDFLPILFDFEKPSSRDTIETVSAIAHLSRFVIADLTNAKSVLQELQHLVQNLPSVPVQPLLHADEPEPGMIDHFRQYRSFLDIHRYDSLEELLTSIDSAVIDVAVDAARRSVSKR